MNSEHEIDPNRGPLDTDEIPFNSETEMSSTLLNSVVLKPVNCYDNRTSSVAIDQQVRVCCCQHPNFYIYIFMS